MTAQVPAKKAQRHNKGFSIIELGMTLIILGGMAVMALKGAELISAMRAFVLVHQITQYQSAILNYQTDYHALPGDDAGAPARWSRAPALYRIETGAVSFAGDGRINGLLTDPGNASGEQYAAWEDLIAGGYVQGRAGLVGQAAQPETPYGGTYGFAEDNLGLDQVLCLTRVPGTDAERLDTRLDDGNPATGKVRATSQWDPLEAHNHFAAPDSAPYVSDKTYIICLPYLP